MATSTATTSAPSGQFIIPLTAATAVDAERVGPKAANLAALLHAGLPTPGGFCLSTDAYRTQIAALGLDPMVRDFAASHPGEQRRLSVEIRLGLYEQPIAKFGHTVGQNLKAIVAPGEVGHNSPEDRAALARGCPVRDRT